MSCIKLQQLLFILPLYTNAFPFSFFIPWLPPLNTLSSFLVSFFLSYNSISKKRKKDTPLHTLNIATHLTNKNDIINYSLNFFNKSFQPKETKKKGSKTNYLNPFVFHIHQCSHSIVMSSKSLFNKKDDMVHFFFEEKHNFIFIELSTPQDVTSISPTLHKLFAAISL